MNRKSGMRIALSELLTGSERWLTRTGLLGFLLAGLCGIWVLLNGAEMPPDGNMAKAFSFNAALGIFLLSTAAIMPFSSLGQRGKAIFLRSYIALGLFSYFAETVQHFRGVNPRYAYEGSTFDVAISGLFGLAALLLILFYIYFAIPFFQRKTYEKHQEMTLGIRYAMAAVMISFAGGVWMSINGGTAVGLEGNLIWFHGLGFHALQLLPVVAWLTSRTDWSLKRKLALNHTAGLSMLGSLAAIGWQTKLGLPIFELTPLPLTAAVLLLLVAAVGCKAFASARTTSQSATDYLDSHV